MRIYVATVLFIAFLVGMFGFLLPFTISYDDTMVALTGLVLMFILVPIAGVLYWNECARSVKSVMSKLEKENDTNA